MEPVTTLLLASSVLLMLRVSLFGTVYRVELALAIPIRFVRAQMKGIKTVGGLWFAIVGAPLAAWFLTTFFILPLLFPTQSGTLNIQTVLALTNPTAVLIFLGLWLGIAFGFIGGTAAYKRNGSKK